MFVRSTTRELASGLGISYMNLTGDLSQANYSSMRQGSEPERDYFRTIQNWFIEMYLKPLFPLWLESAIMSGGLKKVSMSDFDRVNKPIFVARAWGYVDPEKDFNSKLAERRAGATSLIQIVGEKGGRIEDVFKDIAEEKRLAKKYGIDLDFSGSVQAKPEKPAEKEDELIDEAERLLKPQPTNGLAH
jgi:capsid protein